MTYKTFRCAACGGAAHPSTGCQYSEDMLVCLRCTRAFWRWLRDHQNKRYRVGPKGKGAKYIPFPY